MKNIINSIENIETKICNEFAIYDTWAEKYEYLVELGKNLPKLQPEQKIEQNKLANCTSRVWLVFNLDADNRIKIKSESDSLIMAGLLDMVIRLYKQQKLEDVLNSKITLFEKIGFTKYLTNTRVNGLGLILNRLKEKVTELNTKTNLGR
jgi:cysteine desulfuration protein SufE